MQVCRSVPTKQDTPCEQTRAFEHQSSFLTTPRYKVELLRLQGNFSLQHRGRETETHPVLEAEPEKKTMPTPPFPAWALVSATTLLHGLLCRHSHPKTERKKKKIKKGKEAPALGSNGMLKRDLNLTADLKAGRTWKQDNQAAHTHKLTGCRVLAPTEAKVARHTQNHCGTHAIG